ncbi:hypothetical protein DPMN_071083 [Dreissena polymorpha]|uniref:G-protein coupled receptors family 1 profile domain-containing protein n=1 Tax=Dreissena polymorpha TaxID=45954 RepID=A0A9D3Z3X8_DREPO|nr:hypothetical protein DPMN_071083 [Dreissena polymorpha]
MSSKKRRMERTELDKTQTSRYDSSDAKNDATCEGKSQTNDMQQKEDGLNTVSIKYTLIMLVIAAVYLISLLPFFIIVILNAFLKMKDSAQGGALVAYEIGARSQYLPCAINAIIYRFFNSQFRKYYRSKLLLCNRCKVSNDNLLSSSDTTVTTKF